ncbi:D-3-phosphoglycerate dehydrogenase [Orchesella cincta]|uniref:D-3-phosphoglycerate dehydrogenase n=1 Tax=Orchesella cincta TaxID=48709 RepID=A0A1D2MUU4_ORCCI|nr:D-3-phosphoglycerate dehydrogenase [Orchesella cincta]
MPAKILITDPVDAVCANYLIKNGCHVDQIKLSKEQLLENIKNYDGLIVRSETKVTADVLQAATNMKVVGRAGTGVDNVDLDAATKRGILVMNTPGGNTLSAAEHTCALIASMARNIPQACATMKNGAWDRKLFSGNELYGKTLAILGLGRIGKEVALRMQSYGMKTIGYDPIVPAEVSKEFGVESLPLDKIWPQADFITVHVPLIPQTKHLINDEVFSRCKKGVRVVNVARGGIIDEESLLRNLKSGQCGGAGLDVFVEEPPKSEYYKELLNHPKMVCTPHLGASTSEAQLRVAEEIAEQFVTFFKGEGLVGAVNAGSLAVAMSSTNKPWLILARSLGTVTSVLGAVSNIEITVQDPNMKETSFLPAAVVSGYLYGSTGDKNINLINAMPLANEKGIKLSVVKSDTVEAKSLKLTATVGTAKFTVVGKSASDNMGLLTSIDENSFPGGLPMDGSLVFFTGTGSQAGSGFSSIEASLAKKNYAASALYRSTAGKDQVAWYVARVTPDTKEAIDLSDATGIKFISSKKF